MPLSFYSSFEYKKLQSTIAKENWKQGFYDHLIKPPKLRHCKNQDCTNVFKVKDHDPKVFCSSSCAAHFNNTGRKQSLLTRQRISRSISLLPKAIFQRKKIRVPLSCQACGKQFEVTPYLAKIRKYCSSLCAIKTIGSKTTSPKASKGKPGVRIDISSEICFYSTWEANMARVFNLVNLKWQYAPKIFDLGKHTYRPDFYLPDYDTFIEVKNFLGTYSLERDRVFRQKYPYIKLELLLKDDYLQIKSNYKHLVENWEY
ncbi:MAG: hypothetical protein AAB685_02945 [Patescibacteria group bacterium]|mgnify:CR=1 FL=1